MCSKGALSISDHSNLYENSETRLADFCCTHEIEFIGGAECIKTLM